MKSYPLAKNIHQSVSIFFLLYSCESTNEYQNCRINGTSHVVIPKKNKWYTKYSVDAVEKYIVHKVRGETSSAMIQFVPYTSFQ